jgi:hypothetical protein
MDKPALGLGLGHLDLKNLELSTTFMMAFLKIQQ